LVNVNGDESSARRLVVVFLRSVGPKFIRYLRCFSMREIIEYVKLFDVRLLIVAAEMDRQSP